MRNNDMTREQIREAMQTALKNSDSDGYVNAFNQMMDSIRDEIREEYDGKLDGIEQETTARVLAARGVRQLTKDERDYYQKVSEAMKSRDPKQALTNLDVVMPETVINSVFDDLRQNHPLLSRINFMPTRSAIRMLVNTNAHQLAAWG